MLIVRHCAEDAARILTHTLLLFSGLRMVSHLHRSLATELVGGAMSGILIRVRKWKAWYRVLRHGHDFGLVDSVRLGLWLARGW